MFFEGFHSPSQPNTSGTAMVEGVYRIPASASFPHTFFPFFPHSLVLLFLLFIMYYEGRLLGGVFIQP